MGSRITHIDIAKGISICLVALFHSELRNYFNYIIDPMSLFRMPLFFFLSGVFFSPETDIKKFILNKSESLLKPYFSVLIFIFLISVFSGDGALGWQLKGIFYGNGNTIAWTPMWFLTHLFSVYIFSYSLFNISKFKTLPTILKISLLILFVTIGSLSIDAFWYTKIHILKYELELPGLPFSLDIIFVSSFFFILGSVLKEHLLRFKPNFWIFSLSSTAFLLIAINTEAHIDLNERIYLQPLYSTFGSLFGIYIIVLISYLIAKSKSLSFFPILFGEASLYILIFHTPVQDLSHTLFSNFTTTTNDEILLSTISFFLSLLIPLGIKTIIIKSDFLSLFFTPFKHNKLIRGISYEKN